MRNTFINNIRKLKRKPIVNDTTDNHYYLNSNTYQVERNLGESNVIMEELDAIVSTLSDDLRIPFLLQYKGYKYEEIAEVLNVPIGTIKSRIFFARQRLKGRILELYEVQNTAEFLN
jgi:RNA polymerase sigma-70 factor (ECF subfamily)